MNRRIVRRVARRRLLAIVVDGHGPAPRRQVLYLCGDANHDELTDLIFTYLPESLDILQSRRR